MLWLIIIAGVGLIVLGAKGWFYFCAVLLAGVAGYSLFFGRREDRRFRVGIALATAVPEHHKKPRLGRPSRGLS